MSSAKWQLFVHETENIFTFSIISWHWGGTDNWNASFVKTHNAADDLATQGARASAAMIVTK